MRRHAMVNVNFSLTCSSSVAPTNAGQKGSLQQLTFWYHQLELVWPIDILCKLK